MIWNVFQKDFTQLWLLSGIVAIMQMTNAGFWFALEPFNEPQGLVIVAEIFAALTLVGSVALIVLLVHQDVLPGVSQDWLIRPIRRSDLLLSKLLFLLLFVQAPMLLADVAQVSFAGFSFPVALAAAASRNLFVLLSLSLPAFAIATVTRNLIQLAAAAVLIWLVVVIAWASVFWRAAAASSIPSSISPSRSRSVPVDEVYRRQVALLLKVVPLVALETSFALKGGTAINLFLRDMPRLSVDLDLTYVPVKDRTSSLKDIDKALRRTAKKIEAGVPGAHVNASAPRGEKGITKLVVRVDNAQIKIEVTPVLRGCVYEPAVRQVSARVEAEFGFAEMSVVSFADLYAGKMVAALDRQHPRDLFDVRDLLAHEGIDDKLRKAFVAYVISHDRPMAEVLAPAGATFQPNTSAVSKEWSMSLSASTIC